MSPILPPSGQVALALLLFYHHQNGRDVAKFTDVVRKPSACESALWAVGAAPLSHSCEEKKLGGLRNSQNRDLLFYSLSKPSQCLLWARPRQATGHPDVDGPGSIMGEWMCNQQVGQGEGLWDPECIFFSLPHFSCLWASPDFILDRFSPCF